jgi:hypothetical protein
MLAITSGVTPVPAICTAKVQRNAAAINSKSATKLVANKIAPTL